MPHARRLRVFAVGLSILAGYVDALGFISMGGLFVSFMSGNSTQLGVRLAGGNAEARTAAALILCFVLGVVAGTLVARAWPERRHFAVLLAVGGVLSLAALPEWVGLPRLAACAMALAMGAENTVFAGDDAVDTGVTYMTGTLMKLGQQIAAALHGPPRLTWLRYAASWVGLVGGAALGTLAQARLGPGALAVAAVVALLLCPVALRLDTQRTP